MSNCAKGVATVTTVTFGGVTYKVASTPIQKAVTRDAVNVTDVTQGVMQYVAGAVENWDEFTITVYDGGTAPATSQAAAAFAISSSITDGTNTSSVSTSFQALLTKVAPGTIEGEGDRKATLDLTFQPTGTTAASA